MTQEEEDRYSLEEKFDAAVKVIRTLPEDGPFQPSDSMLLMFYSYYKQATLGPCNIPRPLGFWDTREKVKWDAWNALGNMTREEAMKNYVEDIQLILETIPISNEVTDLVEILGNFYTEVESNDEEDEEHVAEKRPFVRPFAMHADELAKKPIMQGYGDLWDDIQNPQEIDDSTFGRSVESVESKGYRESCEYIHSEDEENEDFCEVEYKEDQEMEEKGGIPNAMLLMVEDKKWRSDTCGSNCSSMEPSVSSFTNGTHSSLNSEVEEEELACSIEQSLQNNSYMHLNGYLSDHIAAEKKIRSTDSDNEEFCDSMEHLAVEECVSTSKAQSHGSRATSMRLSELWFESHSSLNCANNTSFLDRITATECKNTLPKGRTGIPGPAGDSPLSLNSACCCVSQSTCSPHNSREIINEQIATALLRLQHDMDKVLHRLQTLEVLAASQAIKPQSPSPEQHLPTVFKFNRPSWWPFQSSPITVVFTVIWPMFAHWLVQFYLRSKRRKIT